jgi:hypothetical protein
LPLLLRNYSTYQKKKKALPLNQLKILANTFSDLEIFVFLYHTVTIYLDEKLFITSLILSKLNISGRKTELGLGKERAETWYGLENRKKRKSVNILLRTFAFCTYFFYFM